MASEDTLIGNDFTFQLGDGASPEGFADMCAVVDVGEIGEEKPLIDVTSLCDNARKYRNGLADGLEIPLSANFLQNDAQLESLYTSYKNDAIRNFRLVTKDSPQDIFAFAATIRGWRLRPPVGEKAQITFTLKVSGEITWTQS